MDDRKLIRRLAVLGWRCNAELPGGPNVRAYLRMVRGLGCRFGYAQARYYQSSAARLERPWNFTADGRLKSRMDGPAAYYNL